MSDEAAAAGCPLHLRADEPVEGTWDRLRMGQVIANLLSNALKYGAGKPVEVAVSGDDARAHVTVRDQGIGIPDREVDRIFGAFERAVPLQNYGGLGLGLYVVAQIVLAHGGHVDVQTRPGQGSTFVVTLPRKAGVGGTTRAARLAMAAPIQGGAPSSSTVRQRAGSPRRRVASSS